MSNPALETIRSVLYWAWDPLGIRGTASARSVYDPLAHDVLTLLNGRAVDDTIADHLSTFEKQRLRRFPDRQRNADVAALLRELMAAWR